jgi:hypothetical protein
MCAQLGVDINPSIGVLGKLQKKFRFETSRQIFMIAGTIWDGTIYYRV